MRVLSRAGQGARWATSDLTHSKPNYCTTIVFFGCLGWLAIIALLVLALICDLILMPALILSPLGKFFVQPKQKPKPAS